MRDHNIVADEWAGAAANPHPHPTPLPIPLPTQTRKVSKTLVPPLSPLWTDGPTD